MTATNPSLFGRSPSGRSLRNRLLIGASLATLTFAGTAHAQENLGARRTVDPSVAAAQAAQSSASRNAQAEAAAARTRASFEAASRARAQMDAAQNAARQAALLAQSNIPNGLGAGGLQVANGVAIDPSLWVGAKGPTQSQGENGRTNVTVDQTQEKAILTWDSFNVGRETDLTFDHHGNTSWMTLNRVTDASADPSEILGSIKAAGSVYIINPNGVIFGGASQVNVRSLIASSLDLHGGAIEYTRPTGASDEAWERLKIAARNQRFNDGILAANPNALQNVPLTFTDGIVLTRENMPVAEVFDPYDGVTVEAGARISVGEEQQAVLLGHNVTNNGTISADNGQVLLAAGRAILLADGNRRQSYEGGDGPAIRGFVVGVDRGGEAINTGLIDVGQGNITLTGKNTTHAGVFSALTGGERAGSILLQAREGMDYQFSSLLHGRNLTGNVNSEASAGWSPSIRWGWGTVTFADGSYSSILPDLDDAPVVGNPFTPSWMQVEGNRIQLLGDTALYLPSGNIELRAIVPQAAIDNSRVYIDRGATIDVSGLGGIEVDMAQNSIRAELRANELRNNPLVRDSDLRGETVYFDGRLGDKLSDGTGVGDLSGWYDLIERDVSQFMTTGGSLSLRGNEVIAREGSKIDLSGGSVRYNDGYVRSTNLIDEFGRHIPIEFAQKGVKYVGFDGDFIVSHARWGVTERFASTFSRARTGTWYAGYDEGRSAGSLLLNQVKASGHYQTGSASTDAIRIFDGSVRADIVVGQHQQDAPTGAGITDVSTIWREQPKLATLEMGNLSISNDGRRALGGNVTIADRGLILADDFTADTALVDYSNNGSNYGSLVEGISLYEHILPSDWFDGRTFGNVNIISGNNRETFGNPTPDISYGGVLTVGEEVAVNLGDYGRFSFSGRQVLIDGSILAPGGNITLEAVRMPRVQDNSFSNVAPSDRPVIRLGGNAVLDVAGRWVNRRTDLAAARRPIDGGAIRLAGYGIELNSGSLLDVSGGAQINADGTVFAGDGGSIVIDNAVPYTELGISQDLPINGALVLDGRFAGYALGKGGSLTINTNRDVYLGEGLIPNEDGLFHAGKPTPEGFRLIEDLTIPAGSPLPMEVPYTFEFEGGPVPPGEALPANFAFAGLEGVVLSEGWTLPQGIRAYANNYSRQYFPGQIIPAGTTLDWVQGTFSAGEILPTYLFPDGVTLPPATLEAVHPVGTILNVDQSYLADTLVPKGTVFGVDVPVLASLRFGTDHFSQGGFASYGLSGARGLTILAGTEIAPTVDVVQVTGNVSSIASGSRLIELLDNGNPSLSVVNSANLEDSLKPAMAVDFRAGPQDGVEQFAGQLRMDTGSSISLHAGSSATFAARTSIYLDGTISTPAGAIRIGDFIGDGSGGSPQQQADIRIGANAKLLAQGVERTTIIDGLPVRSVLSGGTINIGALYDNNLELTPGGLVLIDPHALLDVSGIRGTADLSNGAADRPIGNRGSIYTPVAVDGSAGSIWIVADTGVIGGDLRLNAGGETGAGGSLSITTGGVTSTYANNGIQIQQGFDEDFAVDDLTTYEPGYLTVVADAINASGVGHVTLTAFAHPNLQAQSRGLVFDGDVTLSVGRSLVLGANRLSTAQDPAGTAGNVRIVAPHVVFDGTQNEGANPANPAFSETNTGTFTVDAELIDIFGALRLGTNETYNPLGGYGDGWETTRLIARDDIRIGYNGAFTTGGGLSLESAQVYAAPQSMLFGYAGNEYRERTDTDAGALFASGTSITVRSNGRAASVPYSYGERLTLSAPVIEQGGVLRAPQGQIHLNASERLTLLPGSLTSVSLEGLIVPFGYLNSEGLFDGYAKAGQAPTKSIRLSGPDVVASEGAVLDVSGGGDLLGWTFAGGNDGGGNLLADRSVERYAILPSFGNAPAPTHRSAAAGASGVNDALSDDRLTYGDSVWLDNVPGLAAGWYTLLPAHYALLEGAYLVEALGGQTARALGNQTLPDGSLLTSGYRGVAGTSIREAGYSSFKVMTADAWRPYANFTTTSFNQSARDLANAADLPTIRTVNDAGSVVLAATNSLLLEATGRFGAGEGGLRGNLDVAAERIAVTGAAGAAPEGYLHLDADQLTAFGAGSILLGGTRATGSGGTVVTTAATDILIAGDVDLTGPELLLASLDLLTVEDGARLTASGSAAQDRNSLLLSGDGALLRLSAGERVGLVRTGATGAAGTLAIGDATLTTEGSLSLDGSTIDLADAAALDVGQLDLASVRVNFGDVPEGKAGTTIGLATIARLASARDLLIRGHESIAFYDGAVLGSRNTDGSASLGALTLDTASLVNSGDGATVTAETLTLRNSGAAAGDAPTAGTGDFRVDVDRLALSPGSVALDGFSGIGGMAHEVSLAGTGSLDVAGTVSLATGRIVASEATDYRLGATGDVTLAAGAAPADPEPSALGGRVAIEGRNVRFDTVADLAAGSLTLEATDGDLVVGETARLNLQGRAVDFVDTAKFASGGTVRLAATGDVTTAAGAVLDVSGDERGGDAGAISVAAGGRAALSGTMLAQGHERSAGGSFDLDANGADFAALNTLLNAGRFNASRDIRLREDGIALAAGERIEAHRVSLRSDAGDVRIAGTIAANGDAVNADGGIARLIGANVLLDGTARIEAAAATVDAADYQPASGSVVLAADTGRVSFASGAAIDLSGGRQGGGKIMVRAARTATGADAALDGAVTGAREKLLVGSRVYAADTVDAVLVSTVLDEANAWLAGASAPAGWDRGAGIILRSDGDLSVIDDIDLSKVAGAGYLGLEARGDLLIDANISDGFDGAAADAALGSGGSFSYGFEAGGDILVGEMPSPPVQPVIAGGQPFDASRPFAGALPFTLAADWVVPAGVPFFQDQDFRSWQAGRTIPAGTTITAITWGSPSFPTGYVLPAAAFPDGLTFPPEQLPFTGEGRIVRTGSGDIDVRAGRDLNIGVRSAVYTAGRASETRAGFTRTAAHGDYPTLGGDIRLYAGRDVVSAVANQSSSAWLFRHGATEWTGDPNTSLLTQQTSWSIVFRNFQSGVGALGGGNIAVDAGRDVQDLVVAIPTTGHLASRVGGRADPTQLDIRGGGDLALNTGRDLLGGVVLLGRGQGNLDVGRNVAGGALAPMRTAYNGDDFTSRPVNLLIGLMDAQATIQAVGDIEIEAAYDPMLLAQVAENLTDGVGSAWESYSDRARLWATSISGDIAFYDNSLAASDLSRAGLFEALPSAEFSSDRRQRLIDRSRLAPPTLSLTALGGETAIQRRNPEPGGGEGILSLASSAIGNLELLSNGSLDLRNPIIMQDIAAIYRRNAITPFSTDGTNNFLNLGIGRQVPEPLGIGTNFDRGFTPLHLGDANPVRLVALTGSIGNYERATPIQWTITAPKAFTVYAGTDIVRGNIIAQHNDASAVSTYMAGRDIIGPEINFLGQGLLYVEAGRSINFFADQELQTRGFIISSGNTRTLGERLSPTISARNLALPDVGGDIHLVAGTANGADYEAFSALYLDPANRADPGLPLAHPDNAGKVVQTYEGELTKYLSGLGFSDVTPENRMELFGALAAPTRQAFLSRVLTTELRETGKDYNDSNGPRFQQNVRGYSATELLFPDSTDTQTTLGLPGDIDLKGAPVQTFSGGNINLLAPYGSVTVGFPNERPEYQGAGGVVTRRGGDIAILANRNIALETSRVFTLQGGDILMWTSNGDITAGAGAKTSVFNVPLRFTMDRDGEVSLDVFGLSTGAGIGVLDALQGEDEERRKSRLDLIAFRGEVNAGDAGIRVVGDINIAALRVVNAANIEVSGEAVGIPQIPVVNVGALNAASSATSAIVNEAAQLAERSRPQVRPEVPVIVQVRLLGFGENP